MIETSLDSSPHEMTDRASEALRQRTAKLHRAVERRIDWRRLLSSRSSYGTLLRRLRRVEGAVAAASEDCLTDPPIWLAERRSVAQIERDLAALGESPEPGLLDNSRCPWITSVAGAAGAIYVLEGSTLGGQHLSRAVERDLGFTAEQGAAYLNGYGAETAARWKRTKGWLDEVLATPEDVATAVRSARKTFAFYATVVGGAV